MFFAHALRNQPDNSVAVDGEDGLLFLAWSMTYESGVMLAGHSHSMFLLFLEYFADDVADAVLGPVDGFSVLCGFRCRSDGFGVRGG